jgi:ABC-type dipeptide/oligopeptide/nickel transport system ATPase component
MRADGGGKRRLEAIEGRVPDILKLPDGCHFAPRCSEAMERCREGSVPIYQLSPGRTARCLLFEGGGPAGGDGEPAAAGTRARGTT